MTVECANYDHGPRRARFRVIFPDGRFHPTTACLACAHMLVTEAAAGDYSLHLDAVTTPDTQNGLPT